MVVCELAWYLEGGLLRGQCGKKGQYGCWVWLMPRKKLGTPLRWWSNVGANERCHQRLASLDHGAVQSKKRGQILIQSHDRYQKITLITQNQWSFSWIFQLHTKLSGEVLFELINAFLKLVTKIPSTTSSLGVINYVHRHSASQGACQTIFVRNLH